MAGVGTLYFERLTNRGRPPIRSYSADATFWVNSIRLVAVSLGQVGKMLWIAEIAAAQRKMFWVAGIAAE